MFFIVIVIVIVIYILFYLPKVCMCPHEYTAGVIWILPVHIWLPSLPVGIASTDIIMSNAEFSGYNSAIKE